jgi:hypothetical protein
MHSIRRTFPRLLHSALITLLVLSTGIFGREIPSKPPSIRVLFIGNSYTYFNNLPEIFAKLAEAGHQSRVEIRMEAPGGWRLKDHWEKGAALKALHEERWNYVVLQEQSTLGINYFLEGRPRISSDAFFRPYAKKWAAEIRKAGAIPVFYLTWARKATPEDQGALNYFYIHAARENGALVAPVGIAWAQVRQEQPAIELFFPDGSHPSPTGSYLAACTVYATLFHQNPAGLPGKINGVPVNLNTAKAEPERTAVLADLPMDRAQTVQNAAWAAWQKLEENGGRLIVSPVPVPTVAPLPAGTQLSAADLEGTWSGNLLLYPPPFLPLEMVLHLDRDGAKWKGHLELKFHSKDQRDKSFDLPDLRVAGRELTFTDPKGLQNLNVRFRAVSTQPDELRGTAEATVENPDTPFRLLGTWQLHKN